MLNICFTPSGSGTLRRALREVGRAETVLALVDDLAAGPIGDITGPERQCWFSDYVYSEDGRHHHEWRRNCEFWKTATIQLEKGLRVWLSRNATSEVAAFSHLMCLLPPSAAFELVDFTEIPLPSAVPGRFGRALSVGIINPTQMKTGFDIIKTGVPRDFSADIENWRRLQRESAPLRVFRNRQLVSAGADYFDGILLHYLSPEWTVAARVVGSTMVDETLQPGTHEVSDLWLFHRLWHLVNAGIIECQSEIANPRALVRRADKNTNSSI